MDDQTPNIGLLGSIATNLVVLRGITSPRGNLVTIKTKLYFSVKAPNLFNNKFVSIQFQKASF